MTLENVVWPEANGVYKAVQFLVDGQPYIRSLKFGEGSHIGIVKAFANEICAKTKMDDSELMRFVNQDNHKIVGMGKFELKLEENLAEFFGVSADYVMRINKKHLKLIQSLYPNIRISYNATRLQ